VSRVGTSSVVVSQALFSEGVCIGLADATVVTMLQGRPVPLPDDRRAALTRSLVDFSAPEFSRPS
jgi:acyl-CoA thioesterase FadM